MRGGEGRHPAPGIKAQAESGGHPLGVRMLGVSVKEGSPGQGGEAQVG